MGQSKVRRFDGRTFWFSAKGYSSSTSATGAGAGAGPDAGAATGEFIDFIRLNRSLSVDRIKLVSLCIALL